MRNAKWEATDIINLVIVVGLLVIGAVHEGLDITVYMQTKSLLPDILGTSIVTGLLGYMGGRHAAGLAAKSNVNTGPDATINVQPDAIVTPQGDKQDGS